MTAPAIGRLRHRLTVEAPVDAPDGAGGIVRTYTQLAIVWAAIDPLAARRETDAGVDRAIGTHRIVIRHRTGLTIQHRLRRGGRVFRVLGLIDVGAESRFLDITAEEVAS